MRFKKKIIYGCEERGDANSPYLTRYTLFECKYFQICLHVFYRSDHTEHHDHPWNFLSIILWRGYYEETVVPMPCPKHGPNLCIFDGTRSYCTKCGFFLPTWEQPIKQTRIWPGMFLFRKATHRHRVVLKDEKKAVTLVIMSKRVREWGFFTKKGWIKWTRYFIERGC